MINGAIYKHKKRGSYYVILTREAISQNEDPAHDNQAYVVYQSLKDSSVWVRPREEFFDGRFQHITTPIFISENTDDIDWDKIAEKRLGQ